MQIRPKTASVVAATVLSVLTLSVFAASRGQGPESTVLLFHRAVAKPDAKLIQESLLNYHDPGDQVLVREVRNILSRSREVKLGKVYTQGRKSLVDVYYVIDRGPTAIVIRYVVEKPENKWKVNGAETLALRRQMMDFS